MSLLVVCQRRAIALVHYMLSHLSESERQGTNLDHGRWGIARCQDQECWEYSAQEQELLTTAKKINLLRMPLDTQHGSDLTFRMGTADLERDPPVPHYVAISCVWAQMHPITKRHLGNWLPSPTRPSSLGPVDTPIWLDFFCIPQSDAFEDRQNSCPRTDANRVREGKLEGKNSGESACGPGQGWGQLYELHQNDKL